MELTINDSVLQRKIDFFNQFTLSLKYDAVGSTFSFTFYFNPDNDIHKALMAPGKYFQCTVTHNNETLLTGQILSQNFNVSAIKEMVGISGYSLPGVLEDCEIPTSLYPLQSDGLSLKEIAQKLIKPFGLKMSIDPEVATIMDSTFKTSTAKETQTVKGYLTELAAQKNIIISHNETGELLFTKSKTNQQPLLDFNVPRGGIPATSMTLSYNGQAMHSHITAQKQADSDGGNAGESTVTNPFVLNGVYRPHVISQSSGDDNDTAKVAKAALAAELKNLKLTIKTDRWVVDGKILKPNNIVTVTNPEIYLYNKTNWFIESIDFTGNEKETTATLNCVLPCVYDGSTPKYIF